MLEGEAVAGASPLRSDRPAGPLAFEQALARDRALASPVEPGGDCGPGNVTPPAEAAAARQAAWRRARETDPVPSNGAP